MRAFAMFRANRKNWWKMLKSREIPRLSNHPHCRAGEKLPTFACRLTLCGFNSAVFNLVVAWRKETRIPNGSRALVVVLVNSSSHSHTPANRNRNRIRFISPLLFWHSQPESAFVQPHSSQHYTILTNEVHTMNRLYSFFSPLSMKFSFAFVDLC